MSGILVLLQLYLVETIDEGRVTEAVCRVVKVFAFLYFASVREVSNKLGFYVLSTSNFYDSAR